MFKNTFDKSILEVFFVKIFCIVKGFLFDFSLFILIVNSLLKKHTRVIMVTIYSFTYYFTMLKWSCKKISALVVISALCATFVPVSSLSAESADVDNYYTRIPSQREKALLSARDFAYEYLNNSREEPLWKDKSPYISSEKFFYTVNDEISSYIADEYELKGYYLWL